MNLHVGTGELVALLGANGSGKTTLLRIVAGTVAPDAGTVEFNGRDLTRDVEARSSVSWVLGDEHGWYWRLSGADNLEFFGRLRGASARATRARSAALLAEVGLASAATKPVAEYSTGMRARLGIARARLSQAGVLLLDEPDRGLDAMAATELYDWLREAREFAVLLATHDFGQAAGLAARSIVMRQGRVHQELAGTSSAAELERAVRSTA